MRFQRENVRAHFSTETACTELTRKRTFGGRGWLPQHVKLGDRYVSAMHAHSYGTFNETATDRKHTSSSSTNSPTIGRRCFFSLRGAARQCALQARLPPRLPFGYQRHISPGKHGETRWRRGSPRAAPTPGDGQSLFTSRCRPGREKRPEFNQYPPPPDRKQTGEEASARAPSFIHATPTRRHAAP